MDATSFPPSSSHQPPPLPTPEGAGSKSPPPDRRGAKPWLRVVHWIQKNTFAPEWLPEQLRHPLIGYLAAVLIEGAAVSLILLLLFRVSLVCLSRDSHPGGVVLVALGWGAGPGFVASLVGTFLLYFVVLPPHFSWILADPADGIGLAMYLVVGTSISLLAGQNERARRQAEKTAQLLAQAEARSRIDAERLRTVLDVLPAAVPDHGQPQGQLLAMNQAAQTLWGE